MDISIGENIIPRSFNYVAYLHLNPDTKRFEATNFKADFNITKAYLHWFHYGYKENRKCNLDNVDMNLFDYEKYMDLYPDVAQYANMYPIHEREYIVFNHYIVFGQNENRTFTTIDEGTRRKLKVAIYGGLFNQLFSLVNGIILAHLFKRDLYITNFYIDPFRTSDTISIGRVFNLPELNNFLERIGFYPKVYSCDQEPEWERLSEHNVFGLKWFPYSISILINELYKKNLDMGGALNGMHPLYKGTNEKINFGYEIILANLPFNETFKSAANKLKGELGLDDFVAVHLRLEDDMINFLCTEYYYYYRVNQNDFGGNLYDLYTSLIKKYSTNSKVFVATALLKKPNKYSLSFEELVDENVVINKMNISVDGVYGREISAILEYLICQEGKIFIGYDISTFSNALETFFKCNNKEVVIIKFNTSTHRHFINNPL